MTRTKLSKSLGGFCDFSTAIIVCGCGDCISSKVVLDKVSIETIKWRILSVILLLAKTEGACRARDKMEYMLVTRQRLLINR